MVGDEGRVVVGMGGVVDDEAEAEGGVGGMAKAVGASFESLSLFNFALDLVHEDMYIL